MYAAFVIDVFTRRIVGWRVADDLARRPRPRRARDGDLDPRGEPLDGLVHHSDRGSQYLSIRYTERLAEAGAVTSVGSRGDSYDNAMAEIDHRALQERTDPRRGPWRTVDDVELATLGWVHWWNTRRMLEPVGHVAPVEAEHHWLTTHAMSNTDPGETLVERHT